MRFRYFLVAMTVATFPIAALTSCDGDANQTANSKPAAEAKYHYAVAMTGVV